MMLLRTLVASSSFTWTARAARHHLSAPLRLSSAARTAADKGSGGGGGGLEVDGSGDADTRSPSTSDSRPATRDGPGAHRREGQQLQACLQDALRRIEVLERHIAAADTTAGGAAHARQPRDDAWQRERGEGDRGEKGRPGGGTQRRSESGDGGGDGVEGGPEGTLRTLHPKISKFLSSGYLESQAQ
jgi:hypothetical protein